LNLTHLDDNNRPKMVDVSEKSESRRVAIASGEISMSQEAYDAIISNNTKKGPVLQTAVVAAIMGVKKTSDLIPMCHPLLLTGINCDVEQKLWTESIHFSLSLRCHLVYLSQLLQ
jgi:cyclic pyranopterin phosphate synthase